jgi:hypothetical protein
MPILYVHGVNVRSRDGFHAMKVFARRYVAPTISDDPNGVTIADAYWGDHAFTPTYDGVSRPRTRLLGMGADGLPDDDVSAMAAIDYRDALDRLPTSARVTTHRGGLAAGGTSSGTADFAVDLEDMSAEEIGDLLIAAIETSGESAVTQAELAVAVDSLVTDGILADLIAANETLEAQLDAVFAAIQDRHVVGTTLAGQGISNWAAKAKDRATEALSRARGAGSYALSIAFAEVRPVLNQLASQFMGDVFVYLAKRGQAGAPGVVPQILLDKLVELQAVKEARGGEPLVVISHSMGGQLVYDVVSHFLPQTPALAHIKIDFWCAAASQVGFFEEGKLFINKDPSHKTGNKVPFPSNNLGTWWNVYDENDFLSFSAKDIHEGVDDAAYSSGMTLIKAHGGYLKRPSFFREMAAKIKAAP